MSPSPVTPRLPSAPLLSATTIGGRWGISGLKRGMILWGKSPEVMGSEQDKFRPWVVISNDQIHQHLPVLQAVPCSTREERDTAYTEHRISLSAPTHFTRYQSTPVLELTQLVLTEQSRVFAHERFRPTPASTTVQVFGMVNDTGLGEIEAGLAFVFDLA